MKTLGRIFFIILCLSLLAGSPEELIPCANAASAMRASDDCIDFIKDVEGFSAQPYYDYNQHTVGYGTKCPTDKYFDYLANGIPEEEAEALLQDAVADIEEAIQQKLMDRYGLTFTQEQFDALVSFTFNLGTSWMTYDSSLRNALLSNASDDALIYAISLYCTAGGNYSSGLVTRRLCEVNIYLNGIYSQKVNSDFGYVFYEPNGGSLTYQVQGFVCENRAAPAADAVRSGDVFLGWYTDITGGERVSELTGDLSGKTLFARWQSSENPDHQDSQSTVIRVTGDVVNIRKGPGTNYGVSKKVYCNDVLLLSHVTKVLNRNWGKVEGGWICLEYTNYDDILKGTDHTDGETPDNSTVPGSGSDDSGSVPDSQKTVTGTVRVNDLLRIRSGPGFAYSTVGYLFNGHEVRILEQKTANAMVWGRIDRGWVSMYYIVTEDPTEKEPDKESSGNAESTVWEGTVIADALRIRSGPDTANPIVGFYYQDDRVVIFQKKRVDSVYWGKTDQGWINMDYVSELSSGEEPAPETGKKTVIADCLRVRREIGTDSRISALLYYGDTVTVLETKTVDGTVWGRVNNGWICMDYVI